MTTNVLDLEAGIAITDSRWSLTSLNFFAYVDNVGFEKMVARKQFLLVFAGSGSLIQEWKDWANSLPESLHNMPDFSRNSRAVAVTITDMDSVVVLFERMQMHCEPNARFTGTGAPHAFTHWQERHDATEAVKFAILMDKRSGGEIKFFRFDGKNNLSEKIRFEGLKSKFANEGMIMRTDQSTCDKVVPIRKAAKTDPEVAALVRTIESGEAEILSPCEEMYRPWTEDEKRHFVRVATNVAKHLEKG